MVERLVSLAGPPLGGPLNGGSVGGWLMQWGAVGSDLARLLHRRNGFYVFESALLVRPYEREAQPLGLAQWNARDRWTSAYSDDLSGMLFFAEDVFGGQFCLRDRAVCAFEPETGSITRIAESLELWAHNILADTAFMTGQPTAHDWQAENGPLPDGQRLRPERPFVLGGAYDPRAMYAVSDVEAMRFCGLLSRELRGVSDGDGVMIEICASG